MQIVQKKSGERITFTFLEETFNFEIKDSSGVDDWDYYYADFPRKSSYRIEQNEWLRNVGYLWCVLGAMQIVWGMVHELALTGRGFWLVLGCLCLAVSYLRRIKYSVFKAESGRIFVMQNSKHDDVVNEINQRKKDQLLGWHSEVNLESSLDNETNKYKWLLSEGVMSAEEVECKISEAAMIFEEPGEVLEELLN